MTADQNVSAADNGVTQDNNGNPTETPLAWRWVRARGRQVASALHKLAPFAWPNSSQPATTSLYDAMTGTAEQVASRFVDPYGNVWNFFQAWVVNVLWMLDGAPTPLTAVKLAEYRQLSNQLNPWPTGYPGVNPAQFPGEAFATYPAWPANAPTLDTFLPSPTHVNGTNAAGIIA